MCSRLSVVELFGDWKNLDYGMVFEKSMVFCAAPSVNFFFLQSLLKDGPNLSASYIRQATRIKMCTNQETHWPANRNFFSKQELPSIMARGFVFNGIQYDRNWIIARVLILSHVFFHDFHSWSKMTFGTKSDEKQSTVTMTFVRRVCPFRELSTHMDVFMGGEGLRIYTYARCSWQNIAPTKVVK